ncbi:MAG: glycerol-3-phosphate acyltransferase [Chloroherpetonaceae bacterium]|nr:glycerol-3-phosphate acyltransferase [Chloroherpetonaceae bacterium]MDW8465683.1 glycerol-3-phosphate acyltransferase [Chloroherpetonaceae bacterium]
MWDAFLLAALSYLIGSIPFAFLILKALTGKDIRTLGTGNVGAMNSYDVTGSKAIGITVGVLDALKGVAVVLLADAYFSTGLSGKEALAPKMWATFFAVLGHCYSIWLGFKGGRGLATAAGATLLFMKSMLIAWLVVWVLAWLYSRKLHFCNIAATVSVVLIVPLFEPVEALPFIIFLSGLILLAHRDVMKEAFKGG